MNRLFRFAGYLGFVLFASGIALVILLPKTGRGHPNPAVDTAVTIAVIGYGVMLIRAVQLIFVADGWTRRLAGMFLVVGMALGVIGFVGIALLLQSPAGPVAAG